MLPTTLKTDNLHAHILTRAATKALLVGPLLLWSVNGFALPIGFGVNQGSLEYNEIKNDHFYIYHDSRTPNEGVIALESLEAARPHLESWIGVHRPDGLPVVAHIGAVPGQQAHEDRGHRKPDPDHREEDCFHDATEGMHQIQEFQCLSLPGAQHRDVTSAGARRHFEWAG